MTPGVLVPVVAGGACAALLGGLAVLLATDDDRPRLPNLTGAVVAAAAALAVAVATVAVYLDGRT